MLACLKSFKLNVQFLYIESLLSAERKTGTANQMCGIEIGRWWTTWSNCSIKWWYKTLSNSGTLGVDIWVARYFRGKLKKMYWLTCLDGWLRTLWFAMSLTFSIFIWSLSSEEMKSTKKLLLCQLHTIEWNMTQYACPFMFFVMCIYLCMQ